jgi:hypothetical protein
MRAPPLPEEEDRVAAEDDPNFEVDDGPEFEGFALAAEFTHPTSRKLTPSEG